ncbi:hypothetical protein BCV69DRAFT_283365 [Microstroma glucosiphilum]|uniref:Uncharacterized protein n=1 Tax=Pseudomicrostroma glucosiphilum TaxID=1684307 RepID=A0A316U7Q3_9BASI|nr:hypothetical protein BCV69DRAFT_283365 [Pseudomicrostroma glucosiphilum]PWN20481.1 hypothetical protein BCV69DRAFT_283365 [Pseudomicrostroma glucosiphilum]
MPLGLVSGYDSDSSSGSESGSEAGPSRAAATVAPPASKPLLSNGSSFASKLGLPPPSASSSSSSKTTSNGLASALPPPKASLASSLPAVKSDVPATNGSTSSKRKNQIRIESLADLHDDKDDAGQGSSTASAASSSKKAKMEGKPSMSAASSHGLFGMLPAPSRKGPPTPPRKRQEEEDEGVGVGEARLTLHEEESDSQAQKGVKKGNADFRAMLGLKPSQTAGEGISKPKVIAASTSSSRQPEPPRKAAPPRHEPITPSATEVLMASSRTSTAQAPQQTTTPTPPSQPQPSQAPIDFFSLSSSSSKSHSAPSKPSPLPSSSSSRLAVSSAPSIAEASPYAGWHQNPDGSWVPVTPEAIQAYEAHQASLVAASSNNLQAAGGDARAAEEAARELRKLREQGIDVESLQSVDLEATRAEWEKKPMEARSSSALDAKYAAAAGLASQQGTAGVGDEDEEGAARNEGRKKAELPGAKNARGKGRGQLSNLIAQAAERKDELEQKWAEGKSNRAAAGNRYGW